MKQTSIIRIIILLVLVGCGDDKQSTDDFIMVDVTASYPKKELILQNFMDVEYIPLETTNEFICQGLVMDIGKKYVIVINRNFDGDIFIFNRSGKGVKKINRKGQGNGEYTYITGITLDENRNEMFVNEHLAKRIIVYDLDGNYKRTLKHNGSAMYYKVYNFDNDNLICCDGTVSEQSFTIVSKYNGLETKDIKVNFEKRIDKSIVLKDEANSRSYSARLPYEPIIPYYNNYIITEPSSDTVYIYSSNHDMTPFIVRTPPIQSMAPPEVFLCPSIVTDDYCFMEVVKKEYDFATQQGFPYISLVYDKKNKVIFKYTVSNNDYFGKKVLMSTRPVGNEIATWQNLEAYRLVNAYKSGQLKGRLKEIAAGLDEEDNPVIMLIKYKHGN